MFKFIQQYTEKMEHASIYPMISLLIFFVFFIALLWFVVKIDKHKVQILSHIPLDREEETNTENQ